ncbi:MAG: RluA family pseudouridine synthase [Verrucomicrobia bacterium]|nr:RluA family pseudouridine synthase [Verrucomicrobiota bacterium]MBS0636130.1 RluA family pseudouridine synthase [Verrucomicrobiota bacterium]
MILFEDNHLLALNKPAGLATQSSDHHADSLEEQAKAYIKKAHNKPGAVFLHPIHRLDRPTSGVVLFAKTSKALSRLQEMMREQKLEKTYILLAEGRVEPEEGTLKHNLVHDEHKSRVAKEGKPAILHYKVLEYRENRSLVSVELVTGRYHQIRVQFATIGHPVVGDKKYGSKQAFHGDAIALHHKTLTFIHPVTKAPLEISAPLSQSFQRTLNL